MPTHIFPSDSSEAVLNGLAWDGAHFYLGRQDTPQELYKLSSSFEYLETITLVDLNSAVVVDLTFLNGRAYVADNGGKILEYLMPDWSWVGEPSTLYINDVKGITNDGTALWTVMGGSTVYKWKIVASGLANDGIYYTSRGRLDGIAFDGKDFWAYDYTGNEIVKFGVDNWDGGSFPTDPNTGTPNILDTFQAFASGDGRGMTFTWEGRTTPTLWLNARSYGIWKFQ